MVVGFAAVARALTGRYETRALLIHPGWASLWWKGTYRTVLAGKRLALSRFAAVSSVEFSLEPTPDSVGFHPPAKGSGATPDVNKDGHNHEQEEEEEKEDEDEDEDEHR